jgi:mucin-19
MGIVQSFITKASPKKEASPGLSEGKKQYIHKPQTNQLTNQTTDQLSPIPYHLISNSSAPQILYMTKKLHVPRFITAVACLFALLLAGRVNGQDYTIITTGNNIVITDNTGNGETLTVSQSSTNIRFVVTPTTRTYSIDGGTVTAFTTPADVALSGANSITINAGVGNDNVTFGGFTASLPSLTVNGGAGNDVITFSGDITFAANANLDLDLQNDVATPGTDRVVVAANANLLLSGTGVATVKVSQDLQLGAGASIETVNGNLTVEGNQQATPTGGDFDGVLIEGANSKLACTGTGEVTILGRSGTSSTSFGIAVRTGGKITSNSGQTTVTGRGGLSGAVLNYGVWVNGANSA